MKYFLSIFLIILMSGCCIEGDDGWIDNSVNLIIFDKTGTNNLFDSTGPYNSSDLNFIRDDNGSEIDFILDSSRGTINCLPYFGGKQIGEEITSSFKVIVDTIDYKLSITYKFEDRRCTSYNSAEILSFDFNDSLISNPNTQGQNILELITDH